MSLRDYQRKRNFSKTPEPKGKTGGKSRRGELRFVVQMHRATRLHFDFRLEFGGVFKSWAVPKGPSLSPLDQRLAVFVEDHPIEYGSFEGIIPKGNYGAGTVMIWDEGTYVERGSDEREQSESAMLKGLEKGHLTFVLNGTKLKGEFALIKLKKNDGDKAWLLVKKRDEYATFKRSQSFDDRSVKTGRTIDEIALQSEAEGDIWLPKRKQEEKLSTPAKQKKVAKPVSAPLKPVVKKEITAKTDPMPRRNKPMLATLSRHLVSGDEWIFEPAPEGVRAIAEVEGRRVHLYSRSGLAFEKKFSDIVDSLKSLNQNFVLDGEIVLTKGKPCYYVFDLLYADGTDLRKSPLSERKKVLAKVFSKRKNLYLVEPLKSLAKAQGRVIAKNKASPYHSGTSSDWLILENFSSLQPVKKMTNARAPAKPRPKTKEKAPRQVNKPEIAKPSRLLLSPSRLASGADGPRLTNLDKIYWPEEKITKGDLLNYYREIAPFILPYLKDRPESLNRHPNGIAAPGFYQKDMTGHIPRWLKTKRIYSESTEKSIDYVLCQDERSLLYIVNLGCIEINPWFSRIGQLDKPDFLVIDLDPDGNNFDHVIEIAHEVHDILDAVGAANFCKTSGSTGIHIGVPTQARYHFDKVRAFAEMVCRIVAQKYPATTSIERNPNRRKKKIYLDFMQNRRGQTLAAPFCVRPKAGAPVSMPVTWKDLRPGLRPGDFTIHNSLDLIKKKKDPWQGVLGDAVPLADCIKKLQKKFKIT